MNQTENPLGSKPLPQLLRTFAIPSVLAMLVSSLYNIVDQIFIGQGVVYLGNAATNVAYPLTTICMSIALLIGIGSAARFNLSLGAGESAQARRTVGSAVTMMVVVGRILCGVYRAVCHAASGSVRRYPRCAALCAVLHPYYGGGHASADHHQRNEQPGPGGWPPHLFHALYAAGRGDQHHFGPGIHLCLQMGRRARPGPRCWARPPPV